MGSGRVALAVALFALLATAAPALADDAAVRAAFNSKDAELAKASKARQATQRRWVNSGFVKVRPYLRALGRVRALAGEVGDALEAAEASSDTGRQARRAGIDSFEALEQSVVEAIASGRSSTAAVRAYADHKRKKGNRLRERARKQANRSGRLARRAVRLEKKAKGLLAEL
jgi:hypothetical protein